MVESDLAYLRKQEIKESKRVLKKLHYRRNAFLAKRDSSTDPRDKLHFDVQADNVSREIDAENIALRFQQRKLREEGKGTQTMERA